MHQETKWLSRSDSDPFLLVLVEVIVSFGHQKLDVGLFAHFLHQVDELIDVQVVPLDIVLVLLNELLQMLLVLRNAVPFCELFKILDQMLDFSEAVLHQLDKFLNRLEN